MLLEAIIALAVLGTTAVVALEATTESWRAVARAERVLADTRVATAFLDHVALWPREDLDRHLGERAEGPWRLRVTRETPVLYGIMLEDSTGHVPVLSTSLYRPESPDESER